MIELLTVVAIISIMAVLIGVGLGGGNETVSIGNGQRIASSIFQSARSIAVLRQTETRVVIYGSQGSNTDPRKFLRYMGVVYKDADSTSKTFGEFIPANQGTYLPEGVFFTPDPIPANVVHDATNTLMSSNKDTPADVSFPIKGGTDESFYYYEFDKNGMSENAGQTFVLNAGRVKSEGGSDGVEIEIENPYAAAGFAVRKIGSVILISEYEGLEKANNLTN